MPLTPLESEKLTQYFNDCSIPETQRERVTTIAEMSKDQATIRAIVTAIRSSYNCAGEHRIKLRRRGVW